MIRRLVATASFALFVVASHATATATGTGGGRTPAHRSLASDVCSASKCLINRGGTECFRLTDTCPPCVSKSDFPTTQYSCMATMASGQCPSGTTLCPAPGTVTPAPPVIVTPAPQLTTTAPPPPLTTTPAPPPETTTPAPPPIETTTAPPPPTTTSPTTAPGFGSGSQDTGENPSTATPPPVSPLVADASGSADSSSSSSSSTAAPPPTAVDNSTAAQDKQSLDAIRSGSGSGDAHATTVYVVLAAGALVIVGATVLFFVAARRPRRNSHSHSHPLQEDNAHNNQQQPPPSSSTTTSNTMAAAATAPYFSALSSPSGRGQATYAEYYCSTQHSQSTATTSTSRATSESLGGPRSSATSARSSTSSSTAATRPSTSGHGFQFKSSLPVGLRGSSPAVLALWRDRAIQQKRIPLEAIQMGKEISRGAFGQVCQALYSGHVVAVKKLLVERQRDANEITSFLQEAKLLASLNHPRIVTLVGVAWHAPQDLCLVCEFMDGGDLRGLLAQYATDAHHATGFDSTKLKIAVHVAHAVSYLHSLRPMVLHRDLKSKNILLSKSLDAKLTDFGVSRERVASTMTVCVGSSLWMAPEVLLGDQYDDKADIFSLGVVLSELDTHQLPYTNTKSNSHGGGRLPEMVLLQLVSQGKLQVAFSDHTPPKIVTLARDCLQKDPRDRPTAQQVLDRLHGLWAYNTHKATSYVL